MKKILIILFILLIVIIAVFVPRSTIAGDDNYPASYNTVVLEGDEQH